MLAVVVLLAKDYSGLFLTFLILIFILWTFRPLYLAYQNFKKEIPKKKGKKKNQKQICQLLFIAYLFIFLSSILIFVLSVVFLGKLVHPLVLSFAFILSAIIIFLYHYFSKKEFKGPLWSFSKFFFLATFCLVFSVLFFAHYGLSEGINPEEKNVSFDVYVINNVLTDEKLTTALNDSSDLWSKYNVSIIYNSINKKEINLTSEEVSYLFNNGNSAEECTNYSAIINKIVDNSTELSIIFLDNNNSNHAGRGCLCNCSFALVSPEKLLFFDFTGWNVAHEIGHVLGLSDIQYYGRTRVNLMNDEFKRLLFFNSDFLDQSQINTILNKFNNENETTNSN
jgi:hypothetical protein